MRDYYLIQSGDHGTTYDILYVVSSTSDISGTIDKYSLVDTNTNGALGDSGDLWTANSTYATTFGGYGLAAADNGNGALLYVSTGNGATSGNSVVRLTDTAGYNAAITINPANNVTLYTAPVGMSVKGVAFAPAAVNAAPVVTASTGPTAYTENDAATPIDPALAVSDDGTTLTGATVTVSANYSAAQDVLGFTAPTGNPVTVQSNTGGVLTLTGNATPDQYRDALRSVTYRNNSNDPTTATRTVTFAVTDGTNTSSATGATKTITITAVNNPPTLATTTSTPTYTEGGSDASLFGGTATSTIETGQTITQLTLTVSNVTDGASEILSIDGTDVALTDGNTATTTNGLSVGVSVTAGTATVTISNAAGISTAAASGVVNGLTYRNSSSDPTAGNRVVTLTSITDSGGGTDTTALNLASTVTVAAVNDAPMNGVQSSAITVETNSTTAITGISVADVDARSGSISVNVSVPANSGTFAATAGAGVGVSGNNSMSITLTGTLTDINAFIAGGSLSYVAPAAGATVTVTVLTDDNGNTGGGSLTDSDTFIITVVANAAPVVTASTGPTAYTENDAATPIDPALAVSDDGTTLTGATVTVSANYSAAQDVLGFTAPTGNPVTVQSNTGGVLTLTGNATPDQYRDALRSVTYRNNSNDPTTATRSVTFAVTDGTNTSSATGATKNITITAVNNPPTLATTTSTPTYTEGGSDASLFGGTATSTIETGQTITQLTLTVSNVTDGASEILSIDGTDVALTDGNTATTTNGLSVGVSVTAGTATVTISNAAGISTAAASGVVNGLTYRNSSSDPTAGNRVVTLTSITDSGGGTDTTALNLASTVTVLAVNDSPENAVPGPQTTQQDTQLVFSTLSGNPISISDVDARGGDLKVTLTATNGTLTLATTAGLASVSGNATAVVILSGTVANINTALNGLTFIPTAGYTGAASVQIVTNDQGNTGSSAGAPVPLSDSDTVAITVTVPAPPSAPPLPAPVIPTARYVAIASDAGTNPRVLVLDATTRALKYDLRPFTVFNQQGIPVAAYQEGIRVAVGDVTGDKIDDIVVTSSGSIGIVQVYDGSTGLLARSYPSYGPYGVGLEVAVGDIDGDGRADIVLGAQTGSSFVTVISGLTGDIIRFIETFPAYTGGVRVAVADVTGDRRADIVVTPNAPFPGGLVRVYDSAAGMLLPPFFTYLGYGEQVNITVGDVTGDGTAEILAAASVPGAGTVVSSYSGRGAFGRYYFAPISAGATVGQSRSGENIAARVAAADVTGDHITDILFGSPPGTGVSRLLTINGATGAISDDIAVDPFFDFGVFVDVN